MGSLQHKKPNICIKDILCPDPVVLRCSLLCRKDPAVLKILRDSELLRRGVFTTPPIFTTL